MTRQMTQDAWVILIQTRWHEDDLVGRLTDPMNSYYDPDEAKQWTVIDLPALAGCVPTTHSKIGHVLRAIYSKLFENMIWIKKCHAYIVSKPTL